MFYKIKTTLDGGIFAVPNIIADEYLKYTSEIFLKVLLLLLRQNGELVSDEEVSKKLNKPKELIKEALDYWIGEGFVQTSSSKKKIKETKINKNITVISGTPTKPSVSEVAKLLEENDELPFLIEEAQLILQKLLTPSEASTLVYLYNYVGMPVDIIIMVMHYLASIGKTGMRTVEKTVIEFADQNIFDHDAADKKIKDLSIAAKAHRSGGPAKKTRNSNMFESNIDAGKAQNIVSKDPVYKSRKVKAADDR